jgi:hypothetical protein
MNETADTVSSMDQYINDVAIPHHPPQVEHNGEYVLTTGGSRDFGEIPEEVAEEINRPSGEIRLRIGKHEDGPGNYGQKHIERDDRFKQIQDNGYQNARDLVEDVAQNYDAIYPGKFAPLMLVKRRDEKSPLICVEITEDKTGNFYDVKTGFIARNNYVKNKTPLWVRPQERR